MGRAPLERGHLHFDEAGSRHAPLGSVAHHSEVKRVRVDVGESQTPGRGKGEAGHRPHRIELQYGEPHVVDPVLEAKVSYPARFAQSLSHRIALVSAKVCFFPL